MLSGYRYELPTVRGLGEQRGIVRADWREDFGFGFGLDHQVESPRMGRGLLKVYYNDEPNQNEMPSALPKGADGQRYRLLWRHKWHPLDDTTIVTDLQKYSDANYRKDFLFREEFSEEDVPESFISLITNTPHYTLSGLIRKRVNRFQTVTEALPQVTVNVRPQRIGQTNLFSEALLDVGYFQSKTANSALDAEAFRADWFQELSYAMPWLAPLRVTPKAGVRQTYYSKDIGGVGREDNDHVLVGQFSGGIESSLKLFRTYPMTTNWLGLDINQLRHVLTPTAEYTYIHEATTPNTSLSFPAANLPEHELRIGLENKLQTKRVAADGTWHNVDLLRFLFAVPYQFHGAAHKRGGGLDDWEFDLELFPWPWLRVESDWMVDGRPNTWNFDVVALGGGDGRRHPTEKPPKLRAPVPTGFDLGWGGSELLPARQWALGWGHRYAHNDKSEDVVQWDWRVGPKWQFSTFHRFTWKEVTSAGKRNNFLREQQYAIRRDLHDWIMGLVVRHDRDFGDEVYVTATLKEFPALPVTLETAYREPKGDREGVEASLASP